MIQQPPTCEGCPLHDQHIGIGYMQSEGTGSNGVLVLAEALGEREASEGLPLRPNAPAGSVFQGILRRMSGVDRKQFILSNTIWCRPGLRNYLDGAPYEFAAIEHCQQYNAALVAARRPRAIVTLGAIPTRTVTGFAGEKQGIKLIRGYILAANRPEYFVDGKSIPVIPTYHPSFLLRASKTRSKDKEVAGKVEKAEGGMSLTGVVMRDINLAIDIARNGPPPPHQYEAVMGTQEHMNWLIEYLIHHPEASVAWDIETPHSLAKAADESEIDSIKARVLQIQFAIDDEIGYIFPGFEVDWVREGSQKILSLPNRKLTWNGWKFDDRVVASYGMSVAGENVDLMSAWSWLQPDLPKGLQFATSFYAPTLQPWKHRNQVGDLTYGACDVVAPQILFTGIFNALKDRGLDQSYQRHVLKLRTEMVEAQRRGFPCNEQRHEEFGKKIHASVVEIEKQFPALVPEELLPIEPKPDKKKRLIGFGYVGVPRQIAHLLDGEGNPQDGSTKIVLREEIDVETDDGATEVEIREVVYTRRRVEVVTRDTLESEQLLRWVRVLPFSANSGPQKLAYIRLRREQEIQQRLAKGQDLTTAERLAKYIVPQVRNKSKEMKDNTGAKEMEKLYKSTGDPLFKLLVEISKLNKLKGTYVNGWTPKDDAVHTTFGLADTGTGQLTSKEPNIQNAPKHGDLAKEFRLVICAKPGKVLIEFDKKGFHAMTLARRARDKKYQRMASLDIHSYMTAHRLHLPEAAQLVSWTDKELAEWFAMKRGEPFLYKSEAVPNFPNGLTFDQIRDYKTKRIVHGLGFSQGPTSILEQHPENFKNKKDVQDYIDLFFEQFQFIRPFQQSITKQAHMDTHLISAWNYIRRFYDVFKWDPKKWDTISGTFGAWGHGDDYEAAVAFLPANEAFGMLKEEMLRLAGYRVAEEDERYAIYLADKKIWAIQEGENLLRKYGFCNQIHDSLFTHCDGYLKDEAIERVLGVMNEPCLTLADPVMCPEGFIVTSDASIGPDWAHMKGAK